MEKKGETLNLCLLGRDMTSKHADCVTPIECKFCGFEPHEAARRKQMIRTGGLQVNHWGARQLALGKRT